ncbi:hypothetical protein EDF60_2282 [Leucobacter luti]|uniref:hypothetical protein n=1 Tax=Leucobacter luti TaxID=340320 RepID=UPI001047FFAC|nr:hypothetical protein [Leucobacter luti]MCW2289263.1 hypothetical protein [Leucobacter luti]TCK39826.1 hypothetical protein EDF60_2282 [Leucobacter luti]
MNSQRRVGPALAMTAGVAGALVLAAMFPANAVGEWNTPTDPWEATQEWIMTNSLHAEPGMAPILDSIEPLEQTAEGYFLYGAVSQAGSVMFGFVNETGGVTCGAAEGTPEEEPEFSVAECGWGFSDPDSFGAARVELAPASPTGYRHHLRSFATQAELDASFADHENSAE